MFCINFVLLLIKCFQLLGTLIQQDATSNFNTANVYRMFQCPYCPYSTRRPADLKRHVLTHTGERKFACPKCNFAFNQKCNLMRHIRHRHGAFAVSFVETGDY